MKYNDRKILLGLLSVLMVGGIIVMFIMQMEYMHRIDRIRRDNFFRQCKMALNTVKEEIQTTEMVRYFNSEMKRYGMQGKASMNSRAAIDISDTDTLIKKLLTNCCDTLSRYKLRDSLHEAASSIKGSKLSAQINAETDSATREDLVGQYFAARENINDFLLKYIYDSKKDSLPQLISPHRLVNSVRNELSKIGINNPFYLQLFDKEKRLIYEALTPGMLRVMPTERNSVVQNLFLISHKDENISSPFVRIIFDNPLYESDWQSFLPVVIILLIMLISTIYAFWIMLRQVEFQKQKNDFINNMAHEIKTPVASITLATQMLQDRDICKQPEKFDRILGAIGIESQRIKLLAEKVLQLASFDDGIKPRNELLDINEILLSIVGNLALRIENSGGRLELDLNAENTWVNGDKIHCTNMFYNLIENSIKYARKDVPLELKISSHNRGTNQSAIVIQFRDNGIGINKEHLKHIFERYYRITSGNHHDVKGFGLGLSYVKSVVNNMEGSIIAKSSPKEGTLMKIELPTAKNS